MSNKYCDKHNAGWSDKHYSSCPYCQQEENISNDIEERFNLITELLKDNVVLLSELAIKVDRNEKEIKSNRDDICKIVQILAEITSVGDKI